MMHNEKKLANIVEELTMFFFTIGAAKVQSSIWIEEDQGCIELTSDYKAEYRDRLDSLEEYFNEPKNEGLVDFYWELAGSGDPGEANQLLLVGMMIDKAEVEISDDKATVRLYRKLER